VAAGRTSCPLVLAALVPPVLIGGVYAASRWIERRGAAFYETGRAVVDRLADVARALQARDEKALVAAFSAAFDGTDLALGTGPLVATRDGIRHYRWRASAAGVENRARAVQAWTAYIADFARLDEIGLHLERLESWTTARPIEAIVRFEAIGTPHGETTAGIDRARFRIRFERAGGAGLRIRGAALLEGERIISDRPAFEEVGRAAGIDFVNRHYRPFITEPQAFGMIRYGPAGITAVDYDNDGFYDVFIPDGVESRLFRNLGDGTFEDVTAAAGLSGLDGVSTAVFADYDNDGYKDLFVSRTYKPNQLFRNNGDGTFTDVTADSGIGADCCTTVASWADYNNDGFLDLYVGRYLDPRRTIPTTFYARNGEPNQLYRNNGDGTFTNVTEEAGVGEIGLCLGTVWGDYNDDGYPDLFVVNDFGRSTLYRNNGDGTFTDVTVRAGTLAYGAGMNASMADYDNDGRLDLYTTDIRSEHAWFAEAPTVWRYMLNSWRQGVWRTDMPLYFEMFRQSGLRFVSVFQAMASGNHLLRNRGDGTFESMTESARANPHGWFWGASFSDFDNDGWLDVYAANGWVYGDRGTEMELDFLNNVVSRQDEYKTGRFFDPESFGTRSWHGWERNRHLRNNGDGTFTEIGRGAGTDLVLNSRGVAVADFWNRGSLDIAVAASGDRHALLKNAAPTRAWLEVELVGTLSNRDAVGARVYARVNGQQQMREVVIGDGYASQSALRQHFGLGDATEVDELVVRWPRSGLTQIFRSVAANRIVEVTEGSDVLVEKTYGAPAAVEDARDLRQAIDRRAPQGQ
jgi:hypothetical protein